MKKVNFIYIGLDKSGSTWLHKQMQVHPNIFVPKEKDLYFFDQFYHRGIDWYNKYFASSQPKVHSAIGEICHNYIWSYEAPKRMKEYNKDMKLLLVLRNPYEIFESKIKYGLQKGEYSSNKIESNEIVKQSIDEIFISDNIKQYFKYFKKDEILILLFDDLKSDPKQFLREIYDFLDVPLTVDEQLMNKRINKTKTYRFYFLNKISFRVARLIRLLGFNSIINFARNNFLINKLLFSKKNKKIDFNPTELNKLYPMFNKEIEKMSILINKDLNRWNKHFKDL